MDISINDFSFEIENFQGPLDLLLHLIRKEEMNIFDIPIYKLVEQYENFIKKWKDLNLTIASEYLYLLSVLLNIKAKMLVRGEKGKREEEDPRKPLVLKLIEYEKIKKAAEELKEIYDIWGGVFSREAEEDFIYFEEANIYLLTEAFHSLLKKIKEKKEPAYISRKRPSILKMMKEILNFLPKDGKPLPLSDFLLQLKTPMEVITSFLASLELIKLGAVKFLIKNRTKEIYLVYYKNIDDKVIAEGYI